MPNDDEVDSSGRHYEHNGVLLFLRSGSGIASGLCRQYTVGPSIQEECWAQTTWRRQSASVAQPRHGKALLADERERETPQQSRRPIAIKPPHLVSRHTPPESRERARRAGSERKGEEKPREMASGASSPLLLLPLAAVLLLLLLLVAPRGGEARPPRPLHGVRPLAFDEGYAQIFGSGNLALLRDGRRVRLALDESTGEHPPLLTVSFRDFGENPGGALHFYPFRIGPFSNERRDVHDIFANVLVFLAKPPFLFFLLPAGSGFASQDLFLHGFFSAAIKLPADYAAGVVVAFYLSNGDVYEKTHDELDFEFLGNVRGREWRVQTNVYGNGSTHAGREERYDLPFDPTDDFHHYSILWTSRRIVFYVDETPIREVVRTAAMGAAFPSKPMSLYATIWDGSSWATLGGRYRVNYKYAPFVAEFADLVIRGCAVDPTAVADSTSCDASASLESLAVADEQRVAMAAFRRAHTSYSYCHDRRRYPAALPECGAGDGHGLLPGRMFGPDGMKQQHRRHRAARGRRGGGGAQDDDAPVIGQRWRRD
ncbi:hypothetical protein HU200_042301 [Digitaria exilis]|uniref:xyloglucan:xyloglucosyl transferase n=1 Tax=Digitaria exilis TaxID=1010633 RepID=A0A835B7I9_9POAL|nr:hypothetical protein HU200_042301 [Digitaria exilis]